MRGDIEALNRRIAEKDAEIARLKAALETADDALDQMIDDMADGLCVCQMAKDEAIAAFALVRATLTGETE